MLEWAAQQPRIVFTHDVRTIPGFAFERINKGLPMPRVIQVNTQIGIGATLEDLVLLIEASTAADFENQVRYVPLR